MIYVDVFIGNGIYQTGSGDADFPKSLVASDNVMGGRIAAQALTKAIGDKGKVYVSNTVKVFPAPISARKVSSRR